LFFADSGSMPCGQNQEGGSNQDFLPIATGGTNLRSHQGAIPDEESADSRENLPWLRYQIRTWPGRPDLSRPGLRSKSAAVRDERLKADK
jgi:hypothetical protein